MRGKRDSESMGRGRRRITPADAGKTRHLSQRRRSAQDHPRACGENAKIWNPAPSIAGSPPRMRGKRVGAVNPLHMAGITPAHAGKTDRRRDEPPLYEDHPRACGENYSYINHS